MARNQRTFERPTRRAEAEARPAQHNSLTTEQKIANARSRRGESKKEIARLTK